MSDERLRDLERMASLSDRIEDRAALLAERVRLSRLEPWRLEVAAYGGDAAARLLLPGEFPEVLSPGWQEGLHRWDRWAYEGHLVIEVAECVGWGVFERAKHSYVVVCERCMGDASEGCEACNNQGSFPAHTQSVQWECLSATTRFLESGREAHLPDLLALYQVSVQQRWAHRTETHDWWWQPVQMPHWQTPHLHLRLREALRSAGQWLEATEIASLAERRLRAIGLGELRRGT